MKTNIILTALLCLGLVSSAFAATNEVGTYIPLKIYQTIDPVFPRYLVTSERNGGEAKVAIYVDSDGKLKDWLVIGYTRKGFGDAAVDAIRDWRFDPAKLNGHAIPAVSELSFDFSATGVVISLDLTQSVQAFYALAFERRQYDYSLCSMREIDRIPVPLTTVTPAYPSMLPKQGVKGSARVNFYIDEKGEVRLPCVTVADDYLLGELAVAAVRQWKFEPPTRQGTPTLVKVTQVFNFDADRKVKIEAEQTSADSAKAK
jgi:TonB family protein